VNDSLHGVWGGNTSIWMITSSLEYQNGGPLKQNLTTHMDTRSPVICTSLSSEHFGSSPVY